MVEKIFYNRMGVALGSPLIFASFAVMIDIYIPVLPEVAVWRTHTKNADICSKTSGCST
jgi:hypothetical protein